MQDSTSYADPGLKIWDTFTLATVLTLKSDPERPLFKGAAQSVQPQVSTDLGTAKNLTHFIISIAVLENVPPDAGLQKRATFSTLNVGLAGTGNRTRATCVAGSVSGRSAIHYISGKDCFDGRAQIFTLDITCMVS
jgi:hypothetical protein